tara:strand:+ start:8758 stop:8895 length:138 start_codon:yes stop_codon:yes gene_type:complete
MMDIEVKSIKGGSELEIAVEWFRGEILVYEIGLIQSDWFCFRMVF